MLLLSACSTNKAADESFLAGANFTAGCLSSVLSALKILLFIRSQKRHVIAMYKGKKYFIPPTMSNSPPGIVYSALRYPGMQIAYIVWGVFADSMVVRIEENFTLI
eukprot:m.126059 g.126059  ORF g.126059 m.126059 type:complete len:106 (+) comp37889_c0_seq23:298-615(+)